LGTHLKAWNIEAGASKELVVEQVPDLVEYPLLGDAVRIDAQYLALGRRHGDIGGSRPDNNTPPTSFSSHNHAPHPGLPGGK